MSTMKQSLRFAALLFAFGLFTGCESTDSGGGGGGSTSVNAYYGVGFYDPWYYGGYDDHGDIIVTPPGDRPGRPERPVHPEQPIARPSEPRPRPSSSTPSMSSRPSIPSTPRPMPRTGGGGGRRR